MGNVLEVEEGDPGDVIAVVVKLLLAVKKASNLCGEREPSAVIKGEAEVVDGFGEGCGVSDDYVQFVTVQLKTVFILKKGQWLQQVP